MRSRENARSADWIGACWIGAAGVLFVLLPVMAASSGGRWASGLLSVGRRVYVVGVVLLTVGAALKALRRFQGR